MGTSPGVRNRARIVLAILLLGTACALVLGSPATSSAQIYNVPSSPPVTIPPPSSPPTSPPITSPPATSPTACPTTVRAAGAVDPCATPPITRGDGPNVEGNQLQPGHFEEGPDVLDERFPTAPQHRPATSPESLPFTGAALTLFLALGLMAITLGLLLVKTRRRATGRA